MINRFMVVKRLSCQFSFRRSFLVLKKTAELEKDLAKKEVELRLEKDRAKKESELEKDHAKKESELKLDYALKVQEKEFENRELSTQLKRANTELLKKLQVVGIRAALESIVTIAQPNIRGIQNKIDQDYKSNRMLKKEYARLCQLFNCSNYSDDVPSRIYHALSTHAHGGGLPIRCHLSDSTLSPAEWAFVIAFFRCHILPEAFVVFDNSNYKINLDSL